VDPGGPDGGEVGPGVVDGDEPGGGRVDPSPVMVKSSANGALPSLSDTKVAVSLVTLLHGALTTCQRKIPIGDCPATSGTSSLIG